MSIFHSPKKLSLQEMCPLHWRFRSSLRILKLMYRIKELWALPQNPPLLYLVSIRQLRAGPLGVHHIADQWGSQGCSHHSLDVSRDNCVQWGSNNICWATVRFSLLYIVLLRRDNLNVHRKRFKFKWWEIGNRGKTGEQPWWAQPFQFSITWNSNQQQI